MRKNSWERSSDSQRGKGKPPKKKKFSGRVKKQFAEERYARPKEPANEIIRLNKYLAHAGVASRREADELIKEGLVTVNDKVVKEMGHKVQPDDVVKFRDKVIRSEKKVYILLNK